jgi:predicted ATPase
MGSVVGRPKHGRLPSELTSFVGRTAELALIAKALGDSRLVTLVGPAGVGKRRTALRTAVEQADRFQDGVRLVELSALRDPKLIATTLAGALDLPEQPGMTSLESVAEYLRPRQMLVLLDNCEHLVGGCALLCELLLREAPGLTLLTTFRQPLDVAGEHCLPVAPLPRAEAAELFVQCAATIGGRAFTEADREQVLVLVDRLDGIPLALELAAVRLRALRLRTLVDRLDSRFEMLSGGRRTMLTRHQTLRTTID